MKKLLLIAAMAAVALGASAGYTIEKLWSCDISSINASNARQGLGMNGKFYINDRTESTIYIYDQTGLKGTMTGSPNMTITRDEAGNIIYSNVAFPNNWGLGATITVVNPLTEETNVYQIPEECGELGRCDVLGIAKGNMMENGELYIASNTSGTTIAKLVITDGKVNTDESYNPDCGNVTTSTTTPIYAYTDLEGNDALLYYTRTTNPVKLLPDGDNYAGAAFGLPSRGSTMSVFPFVWDGKELFLYNYKPTGYGDYLDGVCVAEAGASQPIVSVLPTVTTTLAAGLAINWLWAEPDAEGVTIYQYYPSTNDAAGAHVSVYRMTKTTDYTVAGTENLCGTDWNPADTNNDMVLGEDGIYTWTKDVEMTAGTEIKFKVVQDHDWANAWPSQDYYYKFAEDGTYNLKITFDPETEQVKFFVNGEDPNAEMVYTVVGPEDIFGTNWNVNDTNNDMVKDEDDIYIWSKDNVALYGNFGFKVVGNHSYDIYQWPTESNWIANLTQGEGIYNIMITFDPKAEESARITCTLTKIGDITVEHTYTVAGSDNLFDSSWNPADTANDMEKGEDGIYTWTKDDVVFDDAATIEFRIVQDHAWTYAWPSGNWVINDVTEAGTYSFVITFNPAAADDAEKIHVTVTKATQGLRGDVNSDNNVDITDATLLINYLLYGEAPGFNEQNANCDLQGGIDISDATALINYLLNSAWGN